jgi:hypothetical protein
MHTRTVKFLDKERKIVATAQVSEQEGRFSGSIDLSCMPENLRKTFETYEEIANGQIFSLLDEVEDEINALEFTAIFESGCKAVVSDLQIYPSSARVSFRTRAPADVAAAAST